MNAPYAEAAQFIGLGIWALTALAFLVFMLRPRQEVGAPVAAWIKQQRPWPQDLETKLAADFDARYRDTRPMDRGPRSDAQASTKQRKRKKRPALVRSTMTQPRRGLQNERWLS